MFEVGDKIKIIDSYSFQYEYEYFGKIAGPIHGNHATKDTIGEIVEISPKSGYYVVDYVVLGNKMRLCFNQNNLKLVERIEMYSIFN